MKAVSTLALLGVLFLCHTAIAQLRCIATCEYYISSYRASDSAFVELVDMSLDNGSECSPLVKVAKYRVPVTSAGATEAEAQAALVGECNEAASNLARLYGAQTYSPHIFAVHYCG